LFVGIDCHKHRHAAALLDARGGLIDTLLFANGPDGYRELIAWLVEHDAAAAIIGIENPAGFGRPLATALAGAGFEVLNVPAWRTHRDRRRLGPGKTDPGDAHAIAQVVLRCRDALGPALEPELVRALGLLELKRHRLVRDRTMAIQRLRSTWQQVDPVAEAATLRCERQRELRKLKRIRFGDGLADTIAAAIVRELARDIDALNQRIHDVDTQIAALLEEHGNPVADLLGAGNQIAAALIAHAGDVRRFRNAAAFARFCGAAPIPCGSGQNLRPPPPTPRRQPPTQRRALPHRHRPTTPPPTRQGLPRPQDRRRQDPPRSTPRPQAPPRQRRLPAPPDLGRNVPSDERLDIGESNGSFRPPNANGATAASGRPPASATAPCHRSFASITASALTAPPAAGHQSPASTKSASRTPSSPAPARSAAWRGTAAARRRTPAWARRRR
jgi:transposase